MWTGKYESAPCYRTLGLNLQCDNLLYNIPTDQDVDYVISHNEGTSDVDATSPSIGSGDSKLMRDCAIRGYTVGVNLKNPSVEPSLINRTSHHILAYDIETEYLGPSYRSGLAAVQISLEALWATLRLHNFSNIRS